MKPSLLALAGAAAAVLFACPTAGAADAASNWKANCAACHGPDGGGHTKAGRMARVKDLTKPEYQATFTDAQAAAQIKNGLKDSTGKERMKGFGDKLSDDDIAALVALVRGFKKP